MSSQASIKRIRALHRKKGRKESGLAIAQGAKLLDELYASPLEVVELHTTDSLQGSFPSRPHVQEHIASSDDLKRMATMETGINAIAVFRIPEHANIPDKGILFASDGIQDPGNLGTMIRSADNFGIAALILGNGTVDPWNPKCVQSSMGSIFRLPLIVRDLEQLDEMPLFTAEMEGESIYDIRLPDPATVVFGNETHGIRSVLKRAGKMTIPTSGKADSLNVSMAATIVAAELFRRRSQ